MAAEKEKQSPSAVADARSKSVSKKSYPMLPINHWWQLRKKFKQSIPGVVTEGFLATVLDMQPNSARANVLPFLKQLGIIDEEGKTGERANRWRDDEHYPEVCKAMLNEIYPKELLDAVPNPVTDRARAERWFARETGTGAAAARRMAALYVVLAEADPSKQPSEHEKKERPTRKPKEGSDDPARQRAVAAPAASAVSKHQPQEGQPAPGLYINLQIHISADATSDQIDQIFASMAKHIYQRG